MGFGPPWMPWGTLNSRMAVARSTAHCTGGVGAREKESPSASAAVAKAKASLFLEEPG